MNYQFTAFAFAGEVDLNRVAARLSIPRKFRWEEPMKLNPVTFSLAACDDAERVYLYYFGGIVFLNCSGEIIARFLDGIVRFAENLKSHPQLHFREEYRLEIEAGREAAITNDYAVMPNDNQAFIDIICFVIAKSVALERIEERVDTVFDEVEVLIANLGRGTLELPDRDMARLASSILSFKFTSIAHILHGAVKEAAESGIRAICGYAGCEVVELNVQPDHVHLVVLIPPKLAISDLLGRLKGQTSMKLFQQFRHLKKKPYWGNHFWAKGYCVDSVGLDADMIRKYVRYQEKKEQQIEQLQLGE